MKRKNKKSGISETIEKLELLYALIIRQLQSSEARKTIIAVAFLAAAIFFCGMVAVARISTAYSFRDHVAQGDCIDWGSKNLTGEATSSVTTGCQIVESCVAGIDTNATATPSHYVGCTVPTQTGTTKGTVVLGANNVGDTASGTSVTRWIVTGYSTR